MNPFVGAAAIMGGSQLLSGALSAFGGSDEPDYGKQIENWMIQQEYNTPANQVARLRAAGLNPNLIYGNGSAATGNASSGPYHDVGVLKSHSREFAKSLDLSSVILQLQNLKAQANAMNMQADNFASQAEYRDAQTKYTNAILEFYKKHGYFPGQSNVPTNLASEFVNSPGVQSSLGPVAEFIGNVQGAVSSAFSPHEYSGRAEDIANRLADKKGLKGNERERYIKLYTTVYKQVRREGSPE